MREEAENRLAWSQVHGIVQGAAGVAYVDLSPAVGHCYRVLAVYGTHDDNAASRDCLFALQQGSGLAMRDLFTARSDAIGVKLHLYSLCYFQAPLILRYGQTLRYGVAAIAAGKIASMIYTIEDQLGHEVYID
jgi:hypothetical protein